jgi:hypothetical protein
MVGTPEWQNQLGFGGGVTAMPCTWTISARLRTKNTWRPTSNSLRWANCGAAPRVNGGIALGRHFAANAQPFLEGAAGRYPSVGVCASPLPAVSRVPSPD